MQSQHRFSLIGFLVITLGLAGVTWAAPPCDVLVADSAEEVLGTAIPLVTEHAQALTRMGVDVRVRTVGFTSNLDLDEWSMRTQCASWQAPDGRRKSTLLVLMVSSVSRKLGLYYGEAWHRALDDHWNRIKSEVMAPRFRDGDYAGGMIVGLDHLAQRLNAAQDEAIHPVAQTTVVNHTTVHEATDVSSFWFVPWLLVGVVALGAGVFLYFFLRDERDGAQQTQQEAIVAQNEVVALLAHADDAALSLTPSPLQQRTYKAVATAYADFHMSGQGDPQVNGLRRIAYRTMRDQYQTMANALKYPERNNTMPAPWEKESGKAPWEQSKPSHVKSPAPSMTRTKQKPQRSHSTTVVQNNIIATGGNSSSGSSWWSSSSSDTSSSGGGSSSYESGSSGGGGSSSYDSGSSSSSYDGGGGSSGFDSGSSGGGGSSDF